MTLIISIIGLSGIAAQVFILRELLVSFLGNELTLGIILSNWLISEAAGVFLIGKYIDKARDKVNIFIILQIVFSSALPLSIYFSRVFKDVLGLPLIQAVGLNTIFSVSLLIIMPVAFCHGALFSVGCKIYNSIGKAYTWETIGTIIGGIISTYIFIPYLNSFQIAFIISMINLLTCLLVFKYKPNITLILLSLSVMIACFFLIVNSSHFHRLSLEKQWRTGDILEYRNSIYGNIMVTKEESQQTFFYNGQPIITTPHPDIVSLEEFGQIPLLLHPAPKDILIVSGGAGGLISEVLKHPVRKIDYLELDPLIITMLNKHPSTLTKKELEDKRVNIINIDGRVFLKNHKNQYDVVLVGLFSPSELSINRLFTQEFFSLVKKRLNQNGILVFRLPGSLTYLSPELRDLNMSILNPLKKVYNYVRIIPGDYNIFLASSDKEMLGVNPDEMGERINQRNIKTNLLTRDYLEYRLNKKCLDWFRQSCSGATKKINKDFLPFAVFEMLIFWNKQFSVKLAHFLEFFEGLSLKPMLAVVFIITSILFFLFSRNSKLKRLTIAYSIATTGFFGMLINLILIFSFQIIYGYLYYYIGILISIFMSGIAIGSILVTNNLERIKDNRRLFIKVEAMILVFSYLLAMMINSFSHYLHNYLVIFIIIFFIPGFLMGLEFPLASRIYLQDKENIGRISGLLYAADLLGGCVAGILGGIIFLPILGLFNSCMVIIMFKLSSFLLILTA